MDYRTVVIFGGDTDPGHRLTRRSLDAGLRVCAVRLRAGVHDFPEHADLELTSCNVTDRAAVHGVFSGRDGTDLAVVSILGGSLQLNTQGNINVIDAAVAAGVSRFVLTTSIGCGDSAAAVDPFVRVIAGRAIRAKEWAENHLRSTALDWTIVRAGGTTRWPGKGAGILTASTVVTGHISLTDLGDMLFLALASPRAIHGTFAAVDRSRASNIDGTPVLPAEL